MHLPTFSLDLVLWILTFAAQLVLLVALYGRELTRKFPFFSASIVLMTARLLLEKLLTGRLNRFQLGEILVPLSLITALVSLLVIAELARKSLGAAPRWLRTSWALASLLVAAGVLAFWGAWPHAADLAVHTQIAALRLISFAAQKLDLLVDVLTVELGLLVIVAGRRFGAGWRTHLHAIVTGLTAIAAAWLGIQIVWQRIAANAHPTSQAEYQQIIDLGTKMLNGNKILLVLVLVWWIARLWMDEPGAVAASTADAPVLPAESTAEPAAEEAISTEETKAAEDANPEQE